MALNGVSTLTSLELIQPQLQTLDLRSRLESGGPIAACAGGETAEIANTRLEVEVFARRQSGR